ncbi:MAG: cobalt ECF transporter T component CbiQ [Desulfobacteraceae bacterium]|jgi:cobalt/nickel transport system permease protein
MARIESAFYDIGTMDGLSNQDTSVHRLDPRAKVLTTLVFIVMVVSFEKHEVSALIPFFIYPFVLIALGNLPAIYFLKKILLVAPFAFLIAIFNPIIDREILIHVGPLGISGGWVSFTSIMIRFILTVGAALLLIALTGFNAVCMALEKMGSPRIFAIQLLFVYRYLFVLIEEASRVVRARSLRSFRGRGLGIRVFGSMVGQLLLRTLDRAQRIHTAMLCRGFDGEIRIKRPLRIGGKEVGFILGWSALFVVMRAVNIPPLLGEFVRRLVQ